MKHKLLLLAIVFISLFLLKSLLHPGFFTSHDGLNQIVRLKHFHQGLVDGQFPVRWAGNALDGNGYPLFVFTYRLPFWIAEVWYSIFPSLTNSIKFAFIFSYIASGLTMYWFLYTLSRNKTASFWGTLIYQIAPYRFVDILVRSALGEAFTFIFLPLIFLSLYNLSKIKFKWRWLFLLSLSLSGLILSHVMSFFIFLPAIALWFGWQWWQSKNKVKYVAIVIFGSLLSVLLITYYWLPAYQERIYTLFGNILNSYYHDHFVTFKQLLYSKWGFGFSMGGTDQDMMSFQLGVAQWLVIASSILIAIFSLFMNKIKYLKRFLKIPDQFYSTLIFAWLILIFSIFMMLPVSNFVYQIFNKIMVIDLPWKFLGLAVFSSALISTLVVSVLKNQWLKWFFIAVLISVALYTNRNHLRVNEYVYKPDQEYWQSTITSNQDNEYMPKDYLDYDDNKIKTVIFGENDFGEINIIDQREYWLHFTSNVQSNSALLQTNVPLYPGWHMILDGVEQKAKEIHGSIVIPLNYGFHDVILKWQEEPILNVSGDSQNILVQRTSNSFIFNSNVTSEKAQLVLKIAYYPGWQMYIDGIEKKIPLYRGRVAVGLDKGYHKVELCFKDTPLRRNANMISLLSSGGLILSSIYLWKRKLL